MKNQAQTIIDEVAELLESLKPNIGDDFRASDDPDDETPGMCVTIASDDGGEWNYQTGDNSFLGGCYGFRNWGVGRLYRDSDCREVAVDMVDEVFEGIAQSDD